MENTTKNGHIISENKLTGKNPRFCSLVKYILIEVFSEKHSDLCLLERFEILQIIFSSFV